MSYLPLARKYRPQTFDELIGQPHVTATLTRALETKRVAQAYLFTGSRGVGKTSAARILAKCLNCERGSTPAPCGKCASCQQITAGNSLDVIEIDGASNRGIDEIRSLRETVPYAPTTGPFRIYIIDEVHMLTMEAFNALLKTLEEPPAHVKFVFATTAASKVPATILSRCQRFDFRRIESTTIVEALKRIAKAERLQLDEPALYAIARSADGSVRDAEVILEQVANFVGGPISEPHVTELLGAVESEWLASLTDAILTRDAVAALSLLAKPLEQGKEPSQVLLGLLQHLRNLLMLASTREAPSREALLGRLIDEPAERLARLDAQASRSSPQELVVLLQLVVGAYELVRRVAMGRAILELVVMKLATRESWQSLDAISRRLEELRGEPNSPPAPQPPPSGSGSAGVSVETTATPAPQAAPQSVAVAPEQIVAVWPAFLVRLGAQKMSLAAYLADSKPLQLDGGTLTVGLPGFSLHQEVLSLAENRRLIDRLLSELCQTTLTVQYATLPELTPAAALSSKPSDGATEVPPIVQDIVNLFNATILDKPRPLS